MAGRLQSSLSVLRGRDLSRIAGHSGVKSSGTKSAIQARLLDELQVTNLNRGRQRILSIDMGLRNLAFCVVEVDAELLTGAGRNAQTGQNSTQTASGTVRQQAEDMLSQLESVTRAGTDVLRAMRLQAWHHLDLTAGSDEAGELFDPPALAPVVYELVKNRILPLEPDHVLIERQRHRSGGQAAVLEWTFRVNMLESMLWSSLETLRAESRHGRITRAGGSLASLRTHAVLPSRVNAYMLSADEAGRVKASEAKARKTAMAEGWLRSGALRCAQGQATSMRDDFLVAFKAGSRRVSQRQVKAAAAAAEAAAAATAAADENNNNDSDNGDDDASAATTTSTTSTTSTISNTRVAGDGWPGSNSEIGAAPDETRLQAKKLDDLADCLVQAATWIQWDANRRFVLANLK